jgi:hypothetical protein
MGAQTTLAAMAGDDGEPLSLARADARDLGLAIDFHILLRAIEAALPSDATLALEGGETAPAVERYLRDNAAPEPRALEASARAPARVFHVPMTALPGLRLLAEDHPSPEIASHLVVYRGAEVLLWAHDAGGGPLEVARSLPEERVARLREELDWTLKPHGSRRRRLLGLLRRRHE